MSDLLYKVEAFKIIGLCMEVHRELGKGQDEVIYKDALEEECRRNSLPFVRERKYEIEYKGVILPHFYFADFVIFDKIRFEGKACEDATRELEKALGETTESKRKGEYYKQDKGLVKQRG